MASDIWLRTILVVREETHCRHIGYFFRLAARVLLYAPFHRQDSTYHGLCYTSRGALAGTRNSLMGPPHEGSTRPVVLRFPMCAHPHTHTYIYTNIHTYIFLDGRFTFSLHKYPGELMIDLRIQFSVKLRRLTL